MSGGQWEVLKSFLQNNKKYFLVVNVYSIEYQYSTNTNKCTLNSGRPQSDCTSACIKLPKISTFGSETAKKLKT